MAGLLLTWSSLLLSLVLYHLHLQRGKSDALVQAALRLGAAQLILLETPAHAALKETVDVLRMNPLVHVS